MRRFCGEMAWDIFYSRIMGTVLVIVIYGNLRGFICCILFRGLGVFAFMHEVAVVEGAGSNKKAG